MPIIRESPHAKISPDKSPSAWPPRSPFQALLSSPSGRRKWREREEQGSRREVSPSPVKNRVTTEGTGDEEEEEEEEDEETLQLQLQAIEAKLKLKRLQNARKKQTEGFATIKANSSPTRLSTSHSPVRRNRQRDQAGSEIQVPLSPAPSQDRKQARASPVRARLGLTQHAGQPSLKRARDGTNLPLASLSRSAYSMVKATTMATDTNCQTAMDRGSFSDRLAKSRNEANDKRKEEERREDARSRGFDLGRPTRSAPAGERIDCSKERPNSAHGIAQKEMLNATSDIARSASVRSGISTRGIDGSRAATQRDNDHGIFSNAPRMRPVTVNSHNSKKAGDEDDSDPSLSITGSPSRSGQLQNTSQEAETHYEAYTSLHLRRRHLSHTDLARQLQEKEVYPLPRLLKEVKSPDYDPPDVDDFVVLAILASKSSPHDHEKATSVDDSGKPRSKFMVLHLTDLKWTLDLFLFGPAFERWWKLTPGTLIAVLNPGILPPKTQNNKISESGRFSLKLGTGAGDEILEVGVARDLGFCSARRKDGKECSAWVDSRQSGVCDFHLDSFVEREGRKNRMEVNSMWRSHERQGRGREKKETKNGKVQGEYGRLYSVPTGASTAAMLDAEDKPFSAEDEEKSRKRIAAAQRERDLAKKLGEMGTSVGAEYFRYTTKSHAAASGARSSKGDEQKNFFEKPSASELGLLNNRAESAHLSPAKDRKAHFALSGPQRAPEAVGWGGARKAGLLLPETESEGRGRKGIVRSQEVDGSVSERGTGSRSPQKKRARFALERGIREPGRESLGKSNARLESDEDELDIV